MTGNRGRERGFTLVELLVAMVLLGMLSVVLFGGLRFGARAWEAGSQRMERSNEIETTQSVLRRLLGTARGAIVFERDPDRGPGVWTMLGSRSGLSFAAPLPAHRGTGGPHGFALGLERQDDGRALVLRWALHRPESAPDIAGEAGEATVLLQDVAALRIDYYGSREMGDTAEWSDNWEDNTRMPRLVRVRVEFPTGDPRNWPDLTVAPAVAGWASESAG
ncbi:MAG: prepilin-type N-terminal cleavage/methylation domain-containing protein [Inquilinus sp.]|nr:prepilin-type N-terminal cleavage/methylation domain-containing protein [Inquilinus sp.]